MDKLDQLKIPSLTIGDFCDRYTINQIKKEKIKENDSFVMGNIEKIIRDNNLIELFFDLMNKLYKTNETIWKLMDKIVMEEDLVDVGIIAKILIETNVNRVRVKNEISQIFDSDVEHKNYGKEAYKL